MILFDAVIIYFGIIDNFQSVKKNMLNVYCLGLMFISLYGPPLSSKQGMVLKLCWGKRVGPYLFLSTQSTPPTALICWKPRIKATLFEEEKKIYFFAGIAI